MAFINPKSKIHMYVNIGYTVMTVTSMVLFTIAFKWKTSKYMFPAYALVALRVAIRLFDAEDSINFNESLTAHMFILFF